MLPIRFRSLLLTLPPLLLLASGVQAQLTDQPILDRAGARRVIDAAIAEARRLGAPGGAIAVVDAGGQAIALERLDGTFPAAPTISLGKARTAALFQRPTRVFEEIVNEKGRTTMVALPDFTPLMGGVPITAEGHVVGAIGVSGAASAQQDDEIAQAGAAAAASFVRGASPAVTHLDSERVRAAFADGSPLLETGGYKVNASRRDAPGEGEVHERDTDIFYVLEGSATLVTGGTLVGAHATAPGELRGSAIEGGDRQRLGAGDVVVVPSGAPHWFSQVDGPFLYYVIKVSS